MDLIIVKFTFTGNRVRCGMMLWANMRGLVSMYIFTPIVRINLVMFKFKILGFKYTGKGTLGQRTQMIQ